MGWQRERVAVQVVAAGHDYLLRSVVCIPPSSHCFSVSPTLAPPPLLLLLQDIYSLFHLQRPFKFISKTSNFLIPIVGWSMFLTGEAGLCVWGGGLVAYCAAADRWHQHAAGRTPIHQQQQASSGSGEVCKQAHLRAPIPCIAAQTPPPPPPIAHPLLSGTMACTPPPPPSRALCCTVQVM